MSRLIFRAAFMVTIALSAAPAMAQEMPAPYRDVLTLLGRQGDFKDNVLKVNIPRSDVAVTVANVKTPTPFGFGGWIALTKGTSMDVLMGDLVLLQDEVNPVMSALLDHGLEVTALHNHFFWDEPRMFFMHVHGHGAAMDLAKNVKPALDLIGTSSARPAPAAPASAASVTPGPNQAAIARIVGRQGEQNGGVYKITIGRDDLKLTEMGAAINARMGLNTWAAFTGTDANAAIAGDVAMLATEVQPVLRTMRQHGISVVAIHHHMTGTEPTVYFLHYWGTGAAQTLATAFKAAVDQLGTTKVSLGGTAALSGQSTERSGPRVVFVCEHGAAKSVIATAYFNKIAAERGLPYRATFRGTNPQADLSVSALKGLREDGIAIPDGKPAAISPQDVAAATHIFAIGCTLPASARESGKAGDWSDVPEDRGYAATRDAIRRHVEQLLDELAAHRG